MNRKDQLASLVALERQVERGSRRTDDGWQRLQSSLAVEVDPDQAEIWGERLLRPVRNGRWVHLAGVGTLVLAGAAGWLTLRHPAEKSATPALVTPRASESITAEGPPPAKTPEASPASAAPPRAASPGLTPVEPAKSLPPALAPTVKSTAVPAESRAVTVASSRSTFEEELRLIKAARQAVDSGQTSQASALLNQHAGQFPSGVFADEREALRALAACRTANRAQRAALMSGFARAYPRSPYLDRIKRACQPAEEK